MHDIGQLILATSLGEDYCQVIRHARQNVQPICQTEIEMFGASHADVGAYLLGLWGLPNPIIEAVAWHHAPARSLSPGFSVVLAVHVADVLVHESQTDCTEIPPPALDLTALERAGLLGQIEPWRQAALEPCAV
jgi:HD-like signal output (HDOD) protein